METSQPRRPWYDTAEGIYDSLETLEKFNLLIQERRKAHYERKERLNEFYILGSFQLDSCGNTNTLLRTPSLKKDFPDMPSVMTDVQFRDYLMTKGESGSFSVSYSHSVPPDHIRCDQCGKGWEVGNCHDAIIHRKNEVILLADFIGKTFADVKGAYAQKPEAVYSLDMIIRNDRHIDLTPAYPDATDEWEKQKVKNKTGWTEEGIDEHYVIQEGDEASANVFAYFHEACHQAQAKETSEAAYRTIFEKSGFDVKEMKAIPNQYYSDPNSAPWFEVTTEFGVIVFGFRKRVFSINWSQLAENKQEILDLFTGEDVTMSEDYVHAHGSEKATEYLSKIFQYLTDISEPA